MGLRERAGLAEETEGRRPGKRGVYRWRELLSSLEVGFHDRLFVLGSMQHRPKGERQLVPEGWSAEVKPHGRDSRTAKKCGILLCWYE